MMTTTTKATTTDPAALPGGASREDAAMAAPSRLERIVGSRYVTFSALLFAALQALCPAVIAISAVRVLIGLGALAAAAGTGLPATGWHANWIRIPVMAIAAAGAVLNLFVIWHVRRLRARPAAQWRLAPVTGKQLRSERLQIVLALLTFLFLAAEWVTHSIIHPAPHP